MRRVNLEVDGLAVNSLVATSDSRGFRLNFALHVAEIGEATTLHMLELGPFGATSLLRVAICSVDVRLVRVLLDIDQLQDQRPPGANATASGEEVTANDIFEHR